MGTLRIPQAKYDLMVEAFRAKPGNLSNAAVHAGVERRTAHRAWHVGWQNPSWAKSIKLVLEEEQAAIRTRLYEEEQRRHENAAKAREDRQKAEFDAIDERAKESQAVRAALSTSISALAVTGSIAKARLSVAQQASQKIVEAAATGNIEWDKAVTLLTKLQWLDSQAISTLKQSMEILRLHTGDPQSFLKVTGLPATTVDGPKAVEALGGEENLRQAIQDLAEDKITPLTEKLIDYQLEAARRASASN